MRSSVRCPACGLEQPLDDAAARGTLAICESCLDVFVLDECSEGGLAPRKLEQAQVDAMSSETLLALTEEKARMMRTRRMNEDEARTKEDRG